MHNRRFHKQNTWHSYTCNWVKWSLSTLIFLHFPIFAVHKFFSLANDKQQFVLMKANSRGKQCKSLCDVIISWFSTFLTSTCYVQLWRFRCICKTSIKREFFVPSRCMFARGFSGGTLFLWSVWKNYLYKAHIAT